MELSPYSTPQCNSLMHWVNPLRNASNSCGDNIQPCLKIAYPGVQGGSGAIQILHFFFLINYIYNTNPHNALGII